MKTNNRGFTIIEVSVAGFLMVMLAIGIVGLQNILSNSQIAGFVNYVNVDGANYSITQMARELRTMRAGQNGSYPVVYGDSDEISFYSDVDYDGESELVRYYIDGTSLIRSLIEPVGFPSTYPPANVTTKTLTDNLVIDDPTFLYFNEDWPADTANNPLPVPVDIATVRLIRINLGVNVNPNNAEGATYLLNTNVNLRTLKDNL